MRAISLFSGVGGSCLGMKQAGYETHGYELNTWCVDRAIECGCDASVMDLSVETPTCEQPDHVHISSPCLGFTRCATLARQHSSIRNLTVRSAEILLDLNPATFSFENAPECIKYAEHNEFIRLATQRYHIIGFNTDASRLGCCQIRHRFFMIGMRASETSMQALLDLLPTIREVNQRGRRTTIRDALPVEKQIFVYPRGCKDRCLFQPDECLPTLRRMSHATPSTSIHTSVSWGVGVDAAMDKDCIVLDNTLTALASGFPPGYFDFRPREKTRYALAFGNVVPPPVQLWVMQQVAAVRPHAGDGEGGGAYHRAVFPLSRRHDYGESQRRGESDS